MSSSSSNNSRDVSRINAVLERGLIEAMNELVGYQKVVPRSQITSNRGGGTNLSINDIFDQFYGQSLPPPPSDICLIASISYDQRGGGRRLPYFIDGQHLDPQFDFDFSQLPVDHTPFYRGNFIYHRPIGCMRFGINVLNKYGPNNNAWLGQQQTKGERAHSTKGEWPVVYHGTMKSSAQEIVREGFNLAKGRRFRFGVGIYCSPSREAALDYASNFQFKGVKYRLIIQARIDPTKLDIVETGWDHPHDTYWILPNSDAIRPYGVCIYRC